MSVRRLASVLLAAAFIFPVINATAQEPEESPSWRALLHFSTDGLRPDSLDPAFYLQDLNEPDAPTASREYRIAVQRFFEQEDRQAICRFPARYEWLRTKTGRSDAPPVERLCALSDPPTQAYLAFPDAFIGSAASLFGHLFLVLERDHEPLLLADSVDFAANVPDGEDSGFGYFLGGIRGDFSGQIGVQSLHERLGRYSHMERRDVWLYEINLSPTALRLLWLHIEEMQDVDFPYQFFSDNCGYRTLVMLDAVTSSNRRQDFLLTTAPADILRELDREDLLSPAQVIPAVDGRLKTLDSRLPPDIRHRVRRSIRNETLPPSDWLAAHPTAATYLLEYHQDQHRRVSPRNALLARLYPHVTERQIIRKPSDSSRNPIHTQPYHRIEISTWTSHERNGTRLGLSAGYHGLNDRPKGYEPGYAIELLEAEGVIDTEGNFRLESFTPLRVRNFHAFTDLPRRLSIGANVDWHQRLSGPARGRSVARGEVFSGPGWRHGRLLTATNVGAVVEIAGRGGNHSRVLVGPRLDLIWQGETVALAVSAGSYRDLFGNTPHLEFGSANLTWYPHRRLGIDVSLSVEDGRFPERTHSFGLRWHF